MFITILIFIAVLAVLVLAHEFGHFIVAKKFGCRVDEFGFGFPPKLFGFKKGGTEYTLNLLPLGGFVKIKGEQGEGEQDADSFAHKSAGRRVLILAAGVIMNVLVAVVLMQIVMAVGTRQLIDERVSPSAHIEDRRTQIVQILDNSPAKTAGVEPGDIIVSVEGVSQPVTSANLRAALQQEPTKERRIVLKRADSEITKNLAAAKLQETDQYGFGVGLIETGIVSYPLPVALWKGVTQTWYITAETFKAFGGMLHKLFIGEKVSEELAGPVGIAVLTREVASAGFMPLLQLIALLSINLAIINVLPIPALDGGRILFVLIEKLRGGKKVRAQIENIVHVIGFLLLLLLIFIVTYRDIMRIIAH